ncbi:MAG: transcription termination factor NusA [bacterium]|nr:transcription termination factor NusA [bacterium]
MTDNHQEIVENIALVLRERSLERERLQTILEEVFKTALKKMFKLETGDPFQVVFNFDKGDIEIYVEKEIVEDDQVIQPELQIAVSEARFKQKQIADDEGYDFDENDWQVGGSYIDFVNYRTFGRRLIQSTRQMLIQKIRGQEQENTFAEYEKRIGEIIIGEVRQIHPEGIRVAVDKAELLFPRNEQIRTEKYRRGDTIKAVIIEVRRTNKDPEIIVSRRDPLLVRRLFELEVPEIQDNIIEIRQISRDAGERTKIAVDSNDKRIDPVGACVGMKGVRIQAIQRELNGEKIDVIAYTNDRELLIRRAMNPVTPVEILFDPSGSGAVAVIPDDQIALAIGRRHQNIRLASEIVGKNFTIRPIKQSAYYADELPIGEVFGIPEHYVAALTEHGVATAEAVLSLYDNEPAKLHAILNTDEDSISSFIRELSVYFDQSSREG